MSIKKWDCSVNTVKCPKDASGMANSVEPWSKVIKKFHAQPS